MGQGGGSLFVWQPRNMPVISSEVPGADDRLFKSEANSGMSVLVGKHPGSVSTQTLSDGVGGLDQPVICLSVCLVPQWETDEEGAAAV